MALARLADYTDKWIHSGLATTRPQPINECIALIWSDRVNLRDGWVCFCLCFCCFPEDRASSSWSSDERRLISLIFAGRNRIIMIRRELPLTVIASLGRACRIGQARVLLRACPGCCWLCVRDWWHRSSVQCFRFFLLGKVFVFALILVRLQVAGLQQSLLWFQWPR